MKTRITLISIFVLLSVLSLRAQGFRTESFSDRIKTVRVSVVDKWQLPTVIELEGDDVIELSFDEMAESPSRYTYTLTHCNADWTPSRLVQSEYMSGYQHMNIPDYENSFNTTMDYINYKLYFPNQDMTMKVSGNYVVQVYPEDDQNRPVLSACFSVVEAQQTSIGMEISTRTDIDVNKTHQQVNFEVNYTDSKISPMQDLKVYVLQNDRRDNWADLIKPLNIQNYKLTYDHTPKLIFEAGNEYRRFEMISRKYNGMGIYSIEFHAPYYHVELKTDELRSNRSYSYDQDINGKYFIRSQDATDFDTESDYYFVHFYLPCDKPFPEDIFILSEIYNNKLDEKSKMTYSQEDKGYIKTAILKEGHYNYMYVNKKGGISAGSTALIEGNYYQTENEYSVYVYYRPLGGRYDRLIGFKSMSYR